MAKITATMAMIAYATRWAGRRGTRYRLV